MRHPAGLQPEGQLLVQGGSNCRNAGLGALHVLSDELVLEVLGYLTAEDVGRLACVSKAAYCLCDHEDLWKACVLEVFGGVFAWQLTWRDSYVASKGAARQHHAAATSEVHEQPCSISSGKKGIAKHPKKRKQATLPGQPSPALALIRRAVQVPNFYSDLLYQPWHCATVDLDPSWLQVDNIDRRADLTPQQFYRQYELTNTPVVLTGACKHWPALHKWTIPYLKKAYGERPVIAGNFKLPFDTYVSYAENNADEMPLYLFDKEFAHADSGLSHDFSVPDVFQDDLFSVLGGDRPDYRWLIAGPSRSGSSWHIDPNATSAWNAVVCGAKKWLLYPPGIIPPGVHPSVDGADVATPVSLIEWFLNFYDATQEGKVKPLECIVRAGDVMFVPCGWWHACLNLDTWTIAVTQNFVSRANLSHVMSFLASKRKDLVSGCAEEHRGSLHDRFVKALGEQHPQLLKSIEAQQAAAKEKAAAARKLTALFKAAPADKSDHSMGMFGFTCNRAVNSTGTFGFAFNAGGSGASTEPKTGEAVQAAVALDAEQARDACMDAAAAGSRAAAEQYGANAQQQPTASTFKFGFSL